MCTFYQTQTNVLWQIRRTNCSCVSAPDLNLVTSKEFEEGTVKAFDWIKVLAMARRKYLKQVFASI